MIASVIKSWLREEFKKKRVYRGQVLGASNQGPSSFKAADYVPPEISHDIPLCRLYLKIELRIHYKWKGEIFRKTFSPDFIQV